MRRLFRLSDGTRFLADTKKDVELYGAPENPPNTSSYRDGDDLYVHLTKNHGPQFYIMHWSMYQGARWYMEYLTKDQTMQFLEKVSGDYNGFPDDDDIEQLKEYGIDLLEETA